MPRSAGSASFRQDHAGYGGSDPRPAGPSPMPQTTSPRSRTRSASTGTRSTEARTAARTRSRNAVRPDRVVAVAALASVAPWRADGLDWLDGMGQDNLDEFGAALKGEELLRRYLDPAARGDARREPRGDRRDAGVASLPAGSRLPDGRAGAGTSTDQIAEALRKGVDGWVEDDFVFVKPVGLRTEREISVPVQVWPGTRTSSCRSRTGAGWRNAFRGAEEHVLRRGRAPDVADRTDRGRTWVSHLAVWLFSKI